MYNVTIIIACALQGLAWLPMCHPNFFRSFGLPAMATFGLMMHQCNGNSVSKAARMLHKTIWGSERCSMMFLGRMFDPKGRKAVS